MEWMKCKRVGVVALTLEFNDWFRSVVASTGERRRSQQEPALHYTFHRKGLAQVRRLNSERCERKRSISNYVRALLVLSLPLAFRVQVY